MTLLLWPARLVMRPYKETTTRYLSTVVGPFSCTKLRGSYCRLPRENRRKTYDVLIALCFFTRTIARSRSTTSIRLVDRIGNQPSNACSKACFHSRAYSRGGVLRGQSVVHVFDT